jgi:transposase
MDGFVLTDAQWAKMAPHCLGKPGDRGRNGADNRLFVEAVFWIARTGRPWRDLPPRFGKWNSVYVRFRDWRRADVFRLLFEACANDPVPDQAIVEAAIARVQSPRHIIREKSSAELVAVQQVA